MPSIRSSREVSLAVAGSGANSASFRPEGGSIDIGFSVRNGSDASATIVLQGSNDDTNWISTGLTSGALAAGVVGFGATAGGDQKVPVLFRFYRLAATGTGTGTIVADVSNFIQ